MFRIFHEELGRLTGTQDENKQGDPIFLLQYFNNNNNNNNDNNNNMFKQDDQVSYKNCYQYGSCMALKCVEFEKNCICPFQGNYLKHN